MTNPPSASDKVYAIEAELSVLSAILTDPTTALPVVTDILRGDDSEKMFYRPTHQMLYKAMLQVYHAGGTVEVVSLVEALRDAGDLEAVGGLKFISEVWDYGDGATHAETHAKIVRDKYAIREVIRIGEGMVKAATTGRYEAGKIVDHALSRLTDVIERSSPNPLKSRDDFVNHEIERMDREVTIGARMPFEKIHRYVGDFIPGDAVGIPGYSNAGKTLFLSNLADFWATDGTPAIWFPTESQDKFLSRVAARHARIPQVYPERDSWHLASEEQREAYQFALNDLRHCPWQIVPERRITPDQIIAQATMRRREYDGLPVVVAIDHMHRLEYGSANPTFAVGDATRRLRDWAGNDRHGGIILVMLYQPKKPPIDIEVYRPVMGYQISGGNIMPELDIIISPYRRWVKTVPHAQANPAHRTPWGTPRCLWSGGYPESSKPDMPDAKVDDEHVYVKMAKRRTGGEGPTVLLDIDAPSGHISQLSAHEDNDESGARIHAMK